MNITCPACSAQFTVDSSRIPADGLSIRCPECAHTFQYAAEEGATGSAFAGPGRLKMGGETEMRYFVKRPTGKVFGPFDVNAIRIMLDAGKLSIEAEVSPDQQDWQHLSDVAAFADLAEKLGGQGAGPRPAFGRPSPGGTMLGVWADSVAEEIELNEALDLESDEAPASLPRARSTEAGPPELPRPRGLDLPKPGVRRPELPRPSRSGGAPDLPRPAGGADLPRPAGASDRAKASLPRPKGLNLPGLKSGLPAPRPSLPGRGPDLPAPGASLPQSREDLPPTRAHSLPRSSGEDNLPRDPGHDNLPRDPGDANLPRDPGDDNLPVDSADAEQRWTQNHDLFSEVEDDGGDEDLFGEPLDAEDDDLFGETSNAGDLFGETQEAGDLFGEMGNTGDLFGAPAGGDDDLFDAPVQAEEDDLYAASGRDDDDLFGDDHGDEGFNMDGAMPASAFGADDFDARQPGMLGQESSGDLFDAPREHDADEDLFAAPPMADEDEDDLFEAGGLDLEASSSALGGGDDFLSADDNFSFLDEPSEAGAQDVDLAGMSGEWGDDLMSDAPMEEAFDTGRHSEDAWEPEAWEDAQGGGGDFGADADFDAEQPRAPGGAVRQPASRGIRAQTTQQEAVAEDKKRGTTTMLGAVLGAVLVLGGAGYALYSYFEGSETPVVQKTAAPKAGPAHVDLLTAQSDTYAALRTLIDGARKGTLAAGDAPKLLLAESLLLSRYDNSEVAQHAEALAGPLKEASQGWEALGRGAFEAQQGNADAARAYLEPLLDGDEERAFWAQLMMGIGDTLALKKQLSPPDAAAAASTAATEEKKAGEGDENAAQNAQEEAAEKAGEKAEAVAQSGEDAAGKEAEKTAADPKKPALDEAARRLAVRAHAALDAAQKARPDWPVTDYWRGRLFALTAKPDQAIEAWQAAIKASESHVASRVALGDTLYTRGDLNRAATPLQEVTEDFQAHASGAERAGAFHLLGMIHAARQQRDAAIKALTTALSIDVGRSDTIQALAEQYMSAGKYQEALNFFTTNKNLGAENPDVMLGIVRAYMGLEKWDEATAQLQRGGELFPNDARFPLYLGRLHRERGAFFDAQKALKQAIDIDPTLVSAHAALAQLIWLTDKDQARADAHIAQIEAHPDQVDAAVGTEVAGYYQMSQRVDLAETWYATTLQRHPNYWPARLSLARMYLDSGENQKALTLLERAKKEGVKDLRLSAYLADAYRQSRHFAKAVDQINAVIAEHPDNQEYIFIRGRIYFDQGNFDNARQDFNQAYQIDPRFYQAYFFLGRTDFALGDYTKAMKTFRHVLDYKPNNGEFRYWMGRAYEAQNRMTSALSEYRKATVVDEGYGLKNPSIFVRRGELLSRQGYTQEGQQDIARALEINPSMVEARVAMGNSNFRDKLYDEAIEHFQRAIKLDPEQPEVQYKLGMALMYTNAELKGAEHLQLAVRYGYEDPKIFQTLGYLYKRMNKRRAAIDSFKKYLTHIAAQKSAPVEAKREMIRQIEELGGRL